MLHTSLVLALLLACGDRDGGPDGSSDSGSSDGGSSDGGSSDGGSSDGGAGDGGSSDGGAGDGGSADGGGEVERDCNQVSLRGSLGEEEVELGSFAWYAEGSRNILFGIVEADACDYADSLALGGPGDVLAEGIFFGSGDSYLGAFTVGFPDGGSWLDFKVNYDLDRTFQAVGGEGTVKSGGEGQDLVVSSFSAADSEGQTLEGAWTACWCPGLAPFLPE